MMVIYVNDKKVTKKAAEYALGEERLAARIKDAKESWMEDPYREISWMDGMRIEFNI